jgi:phosphoribosylaminoimidazolecarboxamide formyltransferase / IMP cyclohydrolase
MAGNIVKQAEDRVRIKTALISVSDKTGLDALIGGLVEINPDIRILSTGGTFKAITDILGAEASERHLTQVADYTGQPETQGGLVKTLDFRIYLGLLTETHNAAHQEDLSRTASVSIDMVVVNLYPFSQTVSEEGVTVEQARANIDIGGPCMIRAAAKNYLRVCPVVDPSDYGQLLADLRSNGGSLDLAARFTMAQRAFAHTAAYDTAIAAYLGQQDADQVPEIYELTQP